MARLRLLPRAHRNPHGTEPLTDMSLSGPHRRWVLSLPPLRLADANRTEFPKDAVIPYAYRHSFAQRHADAGTPIDVLCELMGHRSVTTTQGYYRVTERRTRAAVEQLAAYQLDGRGNRIWHQARRLLADEQQRLRVGQVAVPFGICTEPSNVKARGKACPFRFRCAGCGHFRTDPSYLPELRDYLHQLLRDRERVSAATELDDWARAEAMPSEAEIGRIRHLIQRAEHDLEGLGEAERREIEAAVAVLRRVRQTVHLGMPRLRPGLEPQP